MAASVQPKLAKSGFTFKQFQIKHDKCGMKVSTDGVLLGAWAYLPECGTVLDIGSGSGLLSLMMAQRLQQISITPQIRAVEIDEAAAQQSIENIHASPWPNAVKVETADFLRWQPQQTECFGAIICNPPYWQAGISCRDEARSRARYTTTLSHDKLLNAAQGCLKIEGVFSLILPVFPALDFCRLAEQKGWFIYEFIEVCEQVQRDPHRVLLKLGLRAKCQSKTQLVIRNTHGQYSDAFCQMTKSFYLSV